MKGKVLIEDTKNCYIRSESRLIVGLDLDNLIVVETNDALLISNKNSSQKVKKIVNKLNNLTSQKVNITKKAIGLGEVLPALKKVLNGK